MPPPDERQSADERNDVRRDLRRSPLEELGARLRLWRYRILHPNRPLLTAEAVGFLARELPRCRTGLEWGSGCSTLWLARRLPRLVSVEHDPKWHAWVCKRLTKRRATGAECLLRSLDGEDPAQSEYVRAVDAFDRDTLGFCLVDGRLRLHCARAAAPKIAPGGMLVLDDAQRYFVPDGPGPAAQLTRKEDADAGWQDVLDVVAGWRCLWSSDIMRSTVIWVKPPSGAAVRPDPSVR